jgi:hypothetical protein
MDFNRYAVDLVIQKALTLGIDVPQVLGDYVCGGPTNGGAVAWVAAHPDEPDDVRDICCDGVWTGGWEGCTCWVPEYDLEQADELQMPASPTDIETPAQLCTDCAFRPGSPERADEWTREALYQSAAEGRPFWCHQGIRRPLRWRHPDGRVIDGSPVDYDPPQVRGIPFRADGRPAALCAGWAYRAAMYRARTEEPPIRKEGATT